MMRVFMVGSGLVVTDDLADLEPRLPVRPAHDLTCDVRLLSAHSAHTASASTILCVRQKSAECFEPDVLGSRARSIACLDHIVSFAQDRDHFAGATALAVETVRNLARGAGMTIRV
jgi:hypothetical protein